MVQSPAKLKLPRTFTSEMAEQTPDNGEIPAHQLRWPLIVPFKVCHFSYTDDFFIEVQDALLLFKG